MWSIVVMCWGFLLLNFCSQPLAILEDDKWQYVSLSRYESVLMLNVSSVAIQKHSVPANCLNKCST